MSSCRSQKVGRQRDTQTATPFLAAFALGVGVEVLHELEKSECKELDSSAARQKLSDRSDHSPRAALERKARAARPALRRRRGKGIPVWVCLTEGGAHPSVDLASAAVLPVLLALCRRGHARTTRELLSSGTSDAGFGAPRQTNQAGCLLLFPATIGAQLSGRCL
jgi:hypothetical protein